MPREKRTDDRTEWKRVKNGVEQKRRELEREHSRRKQKRTDDRTEGKRRGARVG